MRSVWTNFFSTTEQLTSAKDYVAHFVRTPPLKEISKDNGRSCMWVLITIKINIGEIEGVAGDEEIVQDWWVVEHARQVRPY